MLLVVELHTPLRCCINYGRKIMRLDNPTPSDGKQIDISKCRIRMNNAGTAECMVEIRCQWALRVGQSIGLAIHSLKVCRHPPAKRVAESSTESNMDSVLAGYLAGEKT
jgi:hypothetical protein